MWCLCGQPETYQEMDCVGSGSEAALPDSIYNDESPVCPVKSVGSLENFWGTHIAVCRMFFDACMQVMWNAVFYDPMSEYLAAWRKRKVWSGCDAVDAQGIQIKKCVWMTEKLVKPVSSALLLFAAMFLLGMY